MKLQLFSIFDRAARQYGIPFSAANQDMAVRSVRFEVNAKAEGNLLNMSPGDFELFCIAEFDADSGVIVPRETPEFVVRLSDLVIASE